MPAQFQTRVRKAFTLVELLVVIGIIALLLAILLPTVSRARESGRRIKCASNLRTLAIGFEAYRSNYHDHYPALAKWYGPVVDVPEDWIHWPSYRNLADSQIAKTLRNASPDLFRCPSDDVTKRFRYYGPINGLVEYYRYTYTFNAALSAIAYAGQTFHNSPGARIRRSSEVVMLIEEDWATVGHGCFDAAFLVTWLWSDNDPDLHFDENLLANYHDSPHSNAWWNLNSKQLKDVANRPDRNERGNVVFVDGHTEYVPRKFLWNPRNLVPSMP
jgi:prepilin-type N-terminal cleavage/methylation domain-containing protein/prepilin-type processing-associated H-X9-DG protein